MTQNNASAKLRPESHTSRQFLRIFNHPHNFIESNNPYVDPKTGKLRRTKGGKLKPDWRTETRYGIRPRVLLERFNDASDLIGLSFGSKTRFFGGDIDITSNIHPSRNEAGFKAWLGALEDIGLVRPVIIQSSFSGGLHVFYFFEEEIGTFNLACAVEGITQKYGIKIKSGQLELFPNTKGYNKDYKGLKLPLQAMTGSYILDSDYQPFSDDIDTFLQMAETTAKSQDLIILKAACKKYGNQLRLKRCQRGKNSLKNFELDLLKSIQRAFTAAGQTNNLLLDIGCYGVVFMGLDEERGIEPLADYIEETITKLDGYEQYCNHQHEIRKRCLEVAKSSQEFYWAAGKAPKRTKVFKDAFGKNLDSKINGNQAKSIKALQRLQALLDHLKESGETIPTTMTAFKVFLIEKSKTIFGEGFSPVTLGKPTYRSKWLPVFKLLLATQMVVAQPAEATASEIKPEPEVIALTINDETEKTKEQKPLNIQLSLDAFKVVMTVLQTGIKNALNTSLEIAETRTEQQEYTPCKNNSQSESLKPAANKNSTHLALYEGFGMGAAPSSKNKKNLFPDVGFFSEVVSLESDLATSNEFRILKPVLKSQTPASAISPANQSAMEKSRPRLKSEHKQALSLERQQREQEYLEQMQQLHAAQNALEAQRKTLEYQNTAKQGFDAIRRILGTAKAKFMRGNPSPPT